MNVVCLALLMTIPQIYPVKGLKVNILNWVSLFDGMEQWNGTMEWNGMTTPTERTMTTYTYYVETWTVGDTVKTPLRALTWQCFGCSI